MKTEWEYQNRIISLLFVFNKRDRNDSLLCLTKASTMGAANKMIAIITKSLSKRTVTYEDS